MSGKRGSYNKKGQITLFVIIAILVVVGIVAVVLLVPSITKPAMTAEEAQVFLAGQTGAIKTYVQDCMEGSIRIGMNTLGRQGGRIILTEEHFSMPIEVMEDPPIINYALFYDNELGYLNELPSFAEMESELKRFLTSDAGFVYCINDFKSFKQQFDVDAGSVIILDEDIQITKDGVKADFSYPLTLSRAGVKTSVDDYSVSIPINLLEIRDIAARIVNTIAEGKSYEKIMKDQASQQEIKLRDDPNADEIYIVSSAYEHVPSDKSGVIYNDKNVLFSIFYDNPQLDSIYTFNFLVGSQ